MALGFTFRPSAFTRARYDETIRRLDAAGAAAPEGRLYHCAVEVGDLIEVFDVWDSQASFETFGATLVPIMTELGVDVGKPRVSPVHNIVKA
jgi:hypothetical protein